MATIKVVVFPTRILTISNQTIQQSINISSMFTVTRSPLYDFNTLFHTLDSVNQYQQAQQLLQQQYEASRPKIVKKVETEDKYQIQIFKKYGNFNSYEVKVLRNAAYGNSNLINLVIESRRDDFRKVFQFNLNDIEVRDIDWEYFEEDNVLVLNIPKKIKYCADDYINSLLAGMLGVPSVQSLPPAACHCEHRERKHRHRKDRRRDKAEARAEAARAEAEAARIEAARKEAEERARQEAERARKEAEEKAKREAEAAKKLAEQKAAEEKARRVAEEKAKRLAAVRAKKQADLARKQKEEEERVARENLQKQQEFLQALFGGAFPFKFVNSQMPQMPQKQTQQTHQKDASEPVKQSVPVKIYDQRPEQPKETNQEPATQKVEDNEAAIVSESEPESDTESIQSDASTPDSSRSSLKRSGDDLPGGAEKLHRHPSLEEVEDEEFVMFRKKFGN